MKWFACYGPNHDYEICNSENEAKILCDNWIQDSMEDGMWPEDCEMRKIVYGPITHQATMIDKHHVQHDDEEDDNYSSNIDIEYYCNYIMMPIKETA